MAGSSIEVVEPTDHLLLHMSLEMRDADIREVRRVDMTPLGALHTAVRASRFSEVAMDGFRPIAIWGLVQRSTSSPIGYPWMYSGRGIEKHRKYLLRKSRAVVRSMMKMTPMLEVRVDAEYAQALRWARWLGFETEPARPWGPLGESFVRARRVA